MSQSQPSYTPCLEVECDEYATYQGRCAVHQKPWKGSTRKQRLPRDWRSRRNAVLQRDRGVCYLCGGRGADAVDHINQSTDDDHSMGNLAAVHQDVEPYCHRYKTAREGHAAQGYGVPF